MKTKQKSILVLILMLTMLVQAGCSNATAGCPSPTSETKLLTNAEDGYCVLYPAEYSTDFPQQIVINPATDGGEKIGDAWLYIFTADASGLTASQIVDDHIAALPRGLNITRFEMEVDGEQAVVVDGLPGRDSGRNVFIVHNDRSYNLIFMPWYPNPADATPLENLFTMVMDTLHFLPQESIGE